MNHALKPFHPLLHLVMNLSEKDRGASDSHTPYILSSSHTLLHLVMNSSEEDRGSSDSHTPYILLALTYYFSKIHI